MFVYPTERKKTFQAPKRVNAAASKKTPAKIKPGPEKGTASLDVGILFAILLIHNFQYVIPSLCPLVEPKDSISHTWSLYAYIWLNHSSITIIDVG